MLAVIACCVRPVIALVAMLALASLVACESFGVGGAASTPAPDWPVVTLVKPENGTVAGTGTKVRVSAITQSSKGITRIRVLVNGAIVDDLALMFPTPRFDYQRDFKLSGLGQHVITVVAIDSANQSSEQVSTVVTIIAEAPTGTPTMTGTVTPTPYVIYLLATAVPTWTTTNTPYVVYWTATPIPTATRTPTPFVIYVMATSTATPAR